ncbi:DoxX family protein [Arthrobacter sp. 35W]|uniref:DoxX family protein n=1 Tax=Arthrobacter sp. 35W TaxID=1132441 RepID=UPI0004104A56|nr:DoxX family protein [Arthrobacter sp. 35W]
MIIALWIATIVFAAMFAMAGTMKVITPYGQIREKMAWVETVTPPQLKSIGAVEVLGAIGMVLPAATGIAPWLTPLAALGLFVTMVAAVGLHVRRKESVMPSLPLGIVALAIAVGWLVFA